MAKKTKTISQLKKELDAVFSKYIRWAYADDTGYVECYTCYARKPVAQMQNGHFISRRHLSIRYSENNCRPQCPRCNLFAQGEQWLFGTRLTAELGEDIVQQLQIKSKQASKYSTVELQEMIDYYKARLKELL
jgi:hypothetical protein